MGLPFGKPIEEFRFDYFSTGYFCSMTGVVPSYLYMNIGVPRTGMWDAGSILMVPVRPVYSAVSRAFATAFPSVPTSAMTAAAICIES